MDTTFVEQVVVVVGDEVKDVESDFVAVVKSAIYFTSDSTKVISSQLPHSIESNHCSRKSHIIIGTKSKVVKVG